MAFRESRVQLAAWLSAIAGVVGAIAGLVAIFQKVR